MALHSERYGGASSHSGTPEYASPEQLLGEPVDARSDLYSLSLVALYALTGTPPFGGGTIESVLARQTVGALPDIRAVRQDVPAALIRALTRGAARLPGDRFSSAAEYATAIRRATADRPDRGAWWQRLVRRLSGRP